MNEREWLAHTDPKVMLHFLEGKASGRKLRLFACACCRRVWHLLSDERSRRAVEVAEQLPSGSPGAQERRIALAGAQAACRDAAHFDLFREPRVFAARAAYHAISESTLSVLNAAESAASAQAVLAGHADPWSVQQSAARRREVMSQCHLLRDILGNPFVHVAADPSWMAWREGTVPKLAEAIYAERAFERLPILADALEEAGCDNAAVLSHCRQGGEHARGCWVVDQILGKE